MIVSVMQLSSIHVLTGVIAFGLLHGINPSHGWPVAILYSMRSKNPLISGLVSSSIIASAHFVSSIVVVIAFAFLTSMTIIPQLYLRYGATVALAILAYVFWKERGEDFAHTQHGHFHEDSVASKVTEAVQHDHSHWHKDVGFHSHAHTHQSRESPDLKKIASFAFLLGFAHEEEFVILAIAATQATDPVTLILAYASSVAVALIGITVISMKVYRRFFQYKMIYYSKYLPKITALVLAGMAIGFAIGLF
ncbi:MAG: nickel/cobalt transporter [Thermoproteota archaeon]|nr:nickel/cobalt transporter [Thermoproteota archaeon]